MLHHDRAVRQETILRFHLSSKGRKPFYIDNGLIAYALRHRYAACPQRFISKLPLIGRIYRRKLRSKIKGADIIIRQRAEEVWTQASPLHQIWFAVIGERRHHAVLKHNVKAAAADINKPSTALEFNGRAWQTERASTSFFKIN